MVSSIVCTSTTLSCAYMWALITCVDGNVVTASVGSPPPTMRKSLIQWHGHIHLSQAFYLCLLFAFQTMRWSVAFAAVLILAVHKLPGNPGIGIVLRTDGSSLRWGWDQKTCFRGFYLCRKPESSDGSSFDVPSRRWKHLQVPIRHLSFAAPNHAVPKNVPQKDRSSVLWDWKQLWKVRGVWWIAFGPGVVTVDLNKLTPVSNCDFYAEAGLCGVFHRAFNKSESQTLMWNSWIWWFSKPWKFASSLPATANRLCLLAPKSVLKDAAPEYQSFSNSLVGLRVFLFARLFFARSPFANGFCVRFWTRFGFLTLCDHT